MDLPFFKWGEVNFNYLPWRRESEKLEKEGGSIVQGQVFLKEGLALFLFNLLKVYHFYIQNYFTKSSSAARHSQHQQLTSADISSQQWCILQLLMTLLYVEMQVWTSACVAKPTSGASCSLLNPA